MWTTCKWQRWVISPRAWWCDHDRDVGFTSPTYWRRLGVRLVPSILLISAHSTFFSSTLPFLSSSGTHGNSQRPASKPVQKKKLIYSLLTREGSMWATQTEPLLGLCESRNSCSPPSPRLITTQVRLRSARGGFFAGFLGKFWTPRSSSQGSEGQSVHVPLFTEGWCEQILLNIYDCRRVWCHRDNRKPVLTSLTTVLYIRQGRGLSVQLPHQLNGILLLFEMNLHIHMHRVKQ